MTPRRSTNPLHWLPFPVDGWLGEIAGGLRPDQKGALIDLLATAWQQTPPCTLPDDDVYLAGRSGLGSAWKKNRAAILAQFESTGDGRIVCGWLRDMYSEQFTKYENRSTANRTNRRARNGGTREGTNEGTNRTAIGEQNREGEGAVEALPLTGQELLPAPAADAAPAPADAAPRDPDGQNGTGDYLDRPGAREELLRRGLRLVDAPLPIDTAAQIAAREAEQARDAAHYAAAKQAAWAWIRTHPVEAKQLGRTVRADLNFPLDAPLTGLKADTLEAEMVAAISALHEWPSADDWDGVEPFTTAPPDALEEVAS